MTLDNLLEHIDAHVFTGDTFHNKAEAYKLRKYMARWERGLKELDKLVADEPAKHSYSDYVAIKVWGEWMGSFPAYIRTEQKRAAASNAPLDAIYEVNDSIGQWATVGELRKDHFFHKLYATALYDLKGKKL